MARVRYRGDHPEPSFAFRIPASGPIHPHGILNDYRTRRIESVVLPNGRWMPVNPFVAVWLAGARRRHGPWVDVRLTPAEWTEIRRRAPWIRKAKDAVAVVCPVVGVGCGTHHSGLASFEVLKSFLSTAVSSYEVVR